MTKKESQSKFFRALANANVMHSGDAPLAKYVLALQVDLNLLILME